MESNSVNILQAHVAIIVQPAIIQWIIFIILNTGNFLCCCFVIRTAGVRKSRSRRSKKRQKKIMNETFGENSSPIMLETVRERNLQAHEVVEICTAWWWWKTNYLSWHLNVCNSFHPWSIRSFGGGVWEPGQMMFSSSIILWFKFQREIVKFIIYAAGANLIKHRLGLLMRGSSRQLTSFSNSTVMRVFW